MALAFIVVADFDDKRNKMPIRSSYKDYVRTRDERIDSKWVGIKDEYDPDKKISADFRYDGRSVTFDRQQYIKFIESLGDEFYKKQSCFILIYDAGTCVSRDQCKNDGTVTMKLMVFGDRYTEMIRRAERYCSSHSSLEEYEKYTIDQASPIGRSPDAADYVGLLELPLYAAQILFTVIS